MSNDPDDNYISLLMDEVAILLLKRGLTASKVWDHMYSECSRIEQEIEDGELTAEQP